MQSKLYLAVDNSMQNLRLLEESALGQTLEDLGIASGQILVLQSHGIDIGDRSYTSYSSGSSRPSTYQTAIRIVRVSCTMRRTHAKSDAVVVGGGAIQAAGTTRRWAMPWANRWRVAQRGCTIWATRAS